MDGTILGQGSFSSQFSGANPNPGNAEEQAGDAQVIVIPSNVDWIRVLNFTKSGAAGTNAAYFQGVANAFLGVEYFWQRGMAAGTGVVRYYGNGAQVISGDTLVSGGFTLYDPSGQSAGSQPLIGAAVATTASTNATRPVVTTASTAGISVGTVVRMSNTAQTDVNGIDFVVGAVTVNTNFTLMTATNALANVPGAIGGAGFYRIVNNGNTGLFYPRRRYITNITRAVNGNVSTSVAHGLTPGQSVRFNIPAVSGMIQLNPTPANNYLNVVVATVVDDYNFTINVDTSAFTAFTYPTIAQQPSSFPIVAPVGEDTAFALSSVTAQVPTIAGQQIYNTNTGILADSTVNTGFLGMILGGGGNGLALTTPISGPAGSVHFSAGDVITARDTMYWLAGKSTFGGL